MTNWNNATPFNTYNGHIADQGAHWTSAEISALGGSGSSSLSPTNYSAVATSVTNLRLTPVGLDGYCRIPVTAGVAGDIEAVEITAFLDCDITVSDAGGLHSSYTESATQGYDVYLIAKDDGTKNLIMVEAGDVPVTDWALPTGYTKYSQPLHFAINLGGNLLSKVPTYCTSTGRRYSYYTAKRMLVSLASGTTPTELDCSLYVPWWANYFYAGIRLRLSTANIRFFRIGHTSSPDLCAEFGAIDNVYPTYTHNTKLPIAGKTGTYPASIWYSWNGSGTVAEGTIFCRGWTT